MPASCSHLVRTSHGLVSMPRTWSNGRSRWMQRGARHSHMALDIQLPGSRCDLASLGEPSAMSCASAPLKEPRSMQCSLARPAAPSSRCNASRARMRAFSASPLRSARAGGLLP
eukprot:115981-Pyramimonas_sp.AAC.1